MWNIFSRESALWFNLCQKKKKDCIFFPLFLENLVNFSFLTKTTIFFLSYYYFMVPHLNFLTICSSDQISRCFFFWAQPANISAGSKELIASSANWTKHVIETDKTFISQIPSLFLLSFHSYHLSHQKYNCGLRIWNSLCSQHQCVRIHLWDMMLFIISAILKTK